jgi:hypothetical protein
VLDGAVASGFYRFSRFALSMMTKKDAPRDDNFSLSSRVCLAEERSINVIKAVSRGYRSLTANAVRDDKIEAQERLAVVIDLSSLKLLAMTKKTLLGMIINICV